MKKLIQVYNRRMERFDPPVAFSAMKLGDVFQTLSPDGKILEEPGAPGMPFMRADGPVISVAENPGVLDCVGIEEDTEFAASIICYPTLVAALDHSV